MTAFGVGFIFVRVVLGHLPDRIGGSRVALWSLIEAIGQPGNGVARTGRIGCIERGARHRTGVRAGSGAGQFGYAAVYLLGAISALLGAALVIANRSTRA